jgi:hypothetical protein
MRCLGSPLKPSADNWRENFEDATLLPSAMSVAHIYDAAKDNVHIREIVVAWLSQTRLL